MKELLTYLSKYKNLVPPQASKKKVLTALFRDECGVNISEKEIVLSRGGVHLKCHPTVRTEIAHCAPRILSILHKEHGLHFGYIR
jgi:hypothetical protein